MQSDHIIVTKLTAHFRKILPGIGCGIRQRFTKWRVQDSQGVLRWGFLIFFATVKEIKISHNQSYDSDAVLSGAGNSVAPKKIAFKNL